MAVLEVQLKEKHMDYAQNEVKAQCDRAQLGRMIDRPSPTLSQNIDDRIEMLETQVARLKNVKSLLADPAGILNVPIEDLRFAMNY